MSVRSVRRAFEAREQEQLVLITRAVDTLREWGAKAEGDRQRAKAWMAARDAERATLWRRLRWLFLGR